MYRRGESKTLEKFWKRVKKEGSKLLAVAIDMWPAYIESVMENNMVVDIVFDRFHIVRKMNEVVDTTRRQIYIIYREETELHKRKIIKGLRWLLLKKEENLDEEKDEKKRLKEALKINQPSTQIYYLKEELNLLWKQNDIKEAERFLMEWVKKARATTIQSLKKFCNMLLSHRSGILKWYRNKISTEPLEGFNKIKLLKRKPYGYRDNEFFKLKIYALYDTRYALL